jgi:hypothetical protein
MSQAQPITDQRVISYLALRKAIGLIGILLPFVLAGAYMLVVSKIIVRASISDYYYTATRNVLVGDLCAPTPRARGPGRSAAAMSSTGSAAA